MRLGCHRIRGWVLLTRLQFFVYADIEGADIGRQFLHLHMLHCLTCAAAHAAADLAYEPPSVALLHALGSCTRRWCTEFCSFGRLTHCPCFECAAWGQQLWTCLESRMLACALPRHMLRVRCMGQQPWTCVFFDSRMSGDGRLLL